MQIRELLVELNAKVQSKDLDKFIKQLDKGVPRSAKKASQGVKQVEGSARNLASFLGGGGGLLNTLSQLRRSLNLTAFASAAGLGGINAFVDAQLEQIDALGKGAKQLGVSTDTYQVLGSFASQAGVDIRKTNAAMAAMTRNVEAFVRTGKGEAAAAFQRLGFSRAQLRNMRSTTDAFFELGGAIGDLTPGIERNAIAQRVLGEGGIKLLGGFAQGTRGAREQLKVLRRLSVAYDSELIGGVEFVNDRFEEAGSAWKGASGEIIHELLPALRDLAQVSRETGEMFRDWAKQTSALRGFLLLAVGAITLFKSRALLSANKTFIGFLTSMRTGLAGIGAGAGAAGSGITGLLGTIASVAARFVILSGIIGVVLLALEDLWTTFKGGDSIIRRVVDSLTGTGTTAKFVGLIVRSLGESFDTAVRMVKNFFAVLTGQGPGRLKALQYLLWDLTRPLRQLLNLWDRFKKFGAGKVADFIQSTGIGRGAGAQVPATMPMPMMSSMPVINQTLTDNRRVSVDINGSSEAAPAIKNVISTEFSMEDARSTFSAVAP